MTSLTLGEANSEPRVGPVVISEVNYHPGTPSAAALAIDATLTSEDLEFIEINNSTSSPVELTQWRIRGGVDFEFDANSQLAGGQTMVLVSFNPSSPANVDRLAAFRAHYEIGDEALCPGSRAVPRTESRRLDVD